MQDCAYLHNADANNGISVLCEACMAYSVPKRDVVQPSQRRAVLRMGLPAVGEQLLSVLVGLVDTYVVGHLSPAVLAGLGYTSAVALSALGVALQIAWMMTTLFMAIAMGCTVVVARFIGAHDFAEASRTMRQSLLIGAVMGLAGFALAWFLAPQLVGLLSNDPLVIHHGVAYLRIVALSLPFAAVLFVGNAALRGAGDTRTPLITMLVVNVLNAVLSLLLVNGGFGIKGLGINGAAWGATIGQISGGLLVLIILLRGRAGLRIGRFPRPNPVLMWRVLRMGLPFGAEQLVFQIALLMFVSLINTISPVAYAAHNTIVTIESLAFLPGLGIAVAATTLVGQHLGAKEPDLAVQSGYAAYQIGALMMFGIGALLVIAPEFLLQLFVSNNPELVAMAATPLRMAGLVQPFLAANFIFSAALRGGGDAKWPLYTKFLSAWFVRLPLAWLFVSQVGMGLNGIWLAMCIDFTFQGGLSWWRFRQGRWKTSVV